MSNDSDAHDERVVVLDVVGLQSKYLKRGRTPNLSELVEDGASASLRPAFRALTVPMQTTLATENPPAVHGDVASGEYDRETNSVAFWERDRGGRTRLWESASEAAGLTTGALFFQHLIGTPADVAVTPFPIEDENNDMIEMDCWTNPAGSTTTSARRTATSRCTTTGAGCERGKQPVDTQRCPGEHRPVRSGFAVGVCPVASTTSLRSLASAVQQRKTRRCRKRSMRALSPRFSRIYSELATP